MPAHPVQQVHRVQVVHWACLVSEETRDKEAPILLAVVVSLVMVEGQADQCVMLMCLFAIIYILNKCTLF